MKKSEIWELNIEDLQRKEIEFEDQLFKLRFQLATGQIENPGKIRAIRKQVARVKTILREKLRTQEAGKSAGSVAGAEIPSPGTNGDS